MSTKARVQAPGSRTGNLIADSALGLVAETLPHHLNLTVAIWDSGPLGAADIELARLRNAHHVGCVMCQAVRYDVAVKDGLAEEQVSLIDDDYLDSELSDRQKLILQFVDLYALNPRPPEARFQASLDTHFSAAEQTHLALLLPILTVPHGVRLRWVECPTVCPVWRYRCRVELNQSRYYFLQPPSACCCIQKLSADSGHCD